MCEVWATGTKERELKRFLGTRILGLIETKWSQCSDEFVYNIFANRNVDWVAKDAVGSSCGMGSLSSGTRVFFVVYGPQDREEKIAFIHELDNLCGSLASPLCIAGDFNLVRSHDDYRGCRRSVNLMGTGTVLIVQ
ncbi:unnamed protein product [Linum trigynum]|uniref:Endonuclease/exonuclease/phosphatase domain-containing protein n=1 Tax=Linum trigynum TaxID=586398 RepID=A0AAV2FWL8_9ROSI